MKKLVHLSLILLISSLAIWQHGLLVTFSTGLLSIAFYYFIYDTHQFKKLPYYQIISALLIGVGLLSFTPKLFQHVIFFTFFAWVSFRLFTTTHHKHISNQIKYYLSNTFNVFTGLVYLVLGILCTLTFSTKDGIYFIDTHALYTLSISQALKTVSLPVPDLSYAGKSIAYHFFSVKIPLLFSNITGTHILESTYFIVPIVLFFCFLAVLNEMKKITNANQLTLIGACILPFYWNGSEIIGTTLSAYSLATVTQGLASILFLLCAISWQNKNYLFFMLLFFILSITKGSFALVIVGALFFLFIKGENRKKTAFLLAGSTLILGGLIVFFLKDAHPHNLWLIFPGSLLKYLSLNIVILAQIIGVIIFSLRILIKTNQKFDRWMAACLLSGAIGQLLSFEITEWNHGQFGLATSVFFAFCVIPRVKKRHLFVIKLLLAVGCHAMALGSIDQFKNITTGEPNLETSFYTSHSVINAYSWLEKQDTNGVILFSKHYERLSKGGFPRDHFIRSALSGKQLLSEHVKGKGMVMQPDYGKRFAQSLFFYTNFVKQSNISKQETEYFLNPIQPKEAEPFDSPYSLGKKWYFTNTKNKVFNNIYDQLQTYEASPSWMKTFLDTYNIHYIVLEMNDQVSAQLAQITHPIYQKNGITILKRTDIAH